MDFINYFEKPDLKSPILIAGFEGWPNAGYISTDSLIYLKKIVGAKKFAEINPDPFHKYTDNRPHAQVEEGEVNQILFAPYEFFYHKKEKFPDLILFLGKEPDFNWNQFTRTFLQLANDFKVEMLVTIGGTYDFVTHKEEPWVSGVFNQKNLKTQHAQSGLKNAEYTGPISIHTMLLQQAGEASLKGISLWGHAPQYLTSNNLPVVLKVLTYLQEIARAEWDLHELKLQAEELTKQIDLIIKKNPELSKFIERLEKGGQIKKEAAFQNNVINIDDFLKKEPPK